VPKEFAVETKRKCLRACAHKLELDNLHLNNLNLTTYYFVPKIFVRCSSFLSLFSHRLW